MHHLTGLNEFLGCIGTLIYTLQKRVRSLEISLSHLDDDIYSPDQERYDELFAKKWAITVALLQLGWGGPVTSKAWDNPSFWG